MTATIEADTIDGSVIPSAEPRTPPPGDPHLILIDGSGYIFRAYHALPPMTRPDGTPVNAVFGFAQMLEKFLNQNSSSHIAVVHDSARQTFRNDIYPAYKAHRPEPPEDLIPQFALIREATEAFGVAQLELPGYEADDLIACYAKAFEAEGGRVTIVSSDKDLMQLVRERVCMLDPIKQKPIREPEVFEKFGVAPGMVAQVQALAGDATDNVPGVPGIGIKTAAQLLTEYGDLETLLARAGEIKQPKRRELLQTHAEQARISLKLVTLDCDCPLPLPFETLVARSPEPVRLGSFLAENNFRSLLARLGLGDGGPPNRPRPVVQPHTDEPGDPLEIPFGVYHCITDMADLAAWVAEGRAAGVVGLDTETDSLDALAAELVGICLAVAPGRACYVPLRHASQDLLAETPVQLPHDQVIEALRPLLEDPSVLKVLHNAKYDLEVLANPKNGGIQVSPFDDTMMISYALEAGAHGHGMDELSQLHLRHKPMGYDEVTGTGRARISFHHVALDRATCYAAEDADVTLRLWHTLKPRLREVKALSLYEQVERRMIPVLAAMEQAGVKVDGAELARIGADFGERLVVLEAECHRLAGRAFNVGSPKQLGEVLFDEMGLKGGKKGKTGAYSTDASVLEDLAAQGNELPRVVLQHRQLAKLKSTYVEGLTAQIAADGRVHTDYSLASTSTGRLASTEPNLQNIPIRNEEGMKIRRAFVAEPGHVLMSADYSQIELRLLAHLAEVPTLREAFEQGEDIHSRTAAEIFHLDPGKVDKEARRRAKTINFGIIYGMSAFGLGARLGIPAGEARGIIDAYFAQYPGIRNEMERLKDEARMKGYVLSPFGRRLWIQDIGAKDPVRRAGAERQAINAPFQGGAAEIIKRAMVRTPRALREAGLRTRMLLQVHDELVFEVPEAETEAAGATIRKVMEGVAELRVPLLVEVGHGASWAEAH
ncbi:DNA polymerase I [Roseococcus sp. SYP-B2431]|uniref:DNA polymerase I n=1 Tax=Roseococcus sp. SYP-B2431 TaxID=2496640 RepID=UPI00103D356D|nr:DNA polymerase I [Roseococcus sp. SYP-B2431]TCH97932.1 DNA polymerase I [Roseococcus sp. SYP-B2431]